MSSDTPAPKPALIPTTLPLPPQNIHPDELKVILAEAAARHAEAEEALAAAQDHFDAANRAHEYALSEEQKRLEREEQARIDFLRKLYPILTDDAARFKRKFEEACAAWDFDPADAMRWFAAWAEYRTIAWRAKREVLRYDSEQTRDDWELWVRRIAGWHQLIRSVTSWRKDGVLPGEDDDLDGLAAVNAQINEESKQAPRPLSRDAADLSTPYIEDLGLRDPARAGVDLNFSGDHQALDFNHEFSRAVHERSKTFAAAALEAAGERAREEFAAASRSEEGND